MHIPGTPRARAVVVATAAAALTISAPSAATAKAVDDSTLTPHTHFVLQPLNDDFSAPTPATNGEKIPNIDIDKATIRTYYGSPLHGAGVGISNKESSPYITEMKAIEDSWLNKLAEVKPSDDKAIVFDADDTTLWTYDMEDGNPADTDHPGMRFNFNPQVQDQKWVQKAAFPATPGMVDFVKAVQDKGYHVFGITGRSSDQEAATLENLDKVGYTGFDADNFYTKWTVQPWSTQQPLDQPSYVDCTADGNEKCSTVEYKAFTRKHIQDDLGMDIVLNIGDQYSDLQGGYADQPVKLPNPTYYLPSPNIPSAPASDADLALPTEFDMVADGSSGLTTPGDQIPNIDNVKGAIRAYYGATNGIADKQSSLYIDQMKRITKRWAHKVRNECRWGSRKDENPAVVFDSDETTLWGYDMEDGAMKFDFNPTLQNQFVMDESFDAIPGMPKVVRAAANAGCTIVGITGRTGDQRRATLDNLAMYYHEKNGDALFKAAYYFTKPGKTGSYRPYVDSTIDGQDGVSTIDYKASTRRHVEDLGFHIVANFGDQFSDLIGGSSERVVKLPNPTYYLP